MSTGEYNIDGNKAIFRPGPWLAPEIAVPACNANPELSITRVYIAAGSLSLIQRLGVLSAAPSRIFEFGSGYGEGLVALDMYAHAYGVESVTGSEKKSKKRPSAQAVAASLELVDDEVAEDGIAHLAGSPASHYDLIVANMFGPATQDQELIADFTRTGLPALADGGAMVINSDLDTMAVVEGYVAREVDYPARVIKPTHPEVPLAFKAIPKLAISHVVIQKPAA